MTGASVARKLVVPTGWLCASVKPSVACDAQLLAGMVGRL